ncbi:hypothetical protein LCGC14_2565950, partial [marine sediment metagenome]
MAVLNAEVEKLGASIPEQGIADAIWTPGGLLKGLPFFEGNGTLNHVYNREGALPTVGSVPLGGAVPQTDMTVDQQTVSFKWFGSDLLFDRRSVQINSNIQDAKAALAVKQAKAMRRQIEQYLVTGDATSDPNQFDGVNLLYPGTVKATQHAQVKGATGDSTNGAPLIWQDIYSMWDERVHDDAKDNDFWMCNSFVMGLIRTLVRTAAGGAMPDNVMDANFGGPFMVLMGKPVILNNYMGNAEVRGADSDTRSLWYMGVGDEGLHGRLPLGGN